MKVKTQTWDILIGIQLIILAFNLVAMLHAPSLLHACIFIACTISTLIIGFMIKTFEEEKEI